MSSAVPTILFYLLILTLFLGVLATVSSLGVARLEAAHPPSGQFVEVQGVRLTRLCSAVRLICLETIPPSC